MKFLIIQVGFLNIKNNLLENKRKKKVIQRVCLTVTGLIRNVYDVHETSIILFKGVQKFELINGETISFWMGRFKNCMTDIQKKLIYQKQQRV